MNNHRKQTLTEILDSRPGKKVRLPKKIAVAVLRDKRFRPSIGFPLAAEHYRRSNDDGSSSHVVIDGNCADIHRDLWDPHRNVWSLVQHCLFETPIGPVVAVFCTAALLRYLASKVG